MSNRVGSAERPLRVAVVGTGPSGVYAAQALLAAPDLHVEVDLLDRLPTPYGLVRYGVAPDHQKIKSVTRAFDKVMVDDRVRFLGNVELGRAVGRDELRRCYDQVVYAVGAFSDRRLGIPGEDLPGSYSSTEFVAWYNAHPDLADTTYPLRHERVAVIGIGNVALDVARVLAQPPEALATTDIADRALEELRRSRAREIWVLARRGPVQAKCTPSELKEIGALAGVRVTVEPAELELDQESSARLEGDKTAQKMFDHLQRFAAPEPEPELESGLRKIHLRFLASPVEIIEHEGGVGGLVVERNRLEPREGGYLAAVGTGDRWLLPVTMVIRAVGYRSLPLEDLPFDERRGVIHNEDGRLVERDGRQIPGEYVVGWAKRGPVGLIGTNKKCAAATVEKMLEDVVAGVVGGSAKPEDESVDSLLARRGLRVVSWDDWRRLDALEQERGATQGRPRVKLPGLDEMLRELG